MARFPRSQGELLRMARGDLSQRAFAELLRVDKSCLSRYEGGKLGAPVSVISRCLTIVADAQASEGALDIGKALEHVKTAADLLEGKSR
ncbi:helix-turn-helix domain-containing protein [Ralstonia pickettii]|uniref:helix-turn-helix domain-containing protein n=2 Tax=Burkholderiaceae TaxID=119060 RepID=UPI001C720244|nr:helix-turn-helix domain-containing protein [Ralstonia pickettii]